MQKFRAPKFGKLTRFHRRNHRRAIVIDGDVGYTGGMAVSDMWLGHAQDKEHWRDVMFKVTGPMARSLQTAFVDQVGQLLRRVADRSAELPVSGAGAPRAGVEQFVHLASSPADDDQSMANFFLLPILAARESIYLASPYFIPDKHLQERSFRERETASTCACCCRDRTPTTGSRARARRRDIRSCWRPA